MRSTTFGMRLAGVAAFGLALSACSMGGLSGAPSAQTQQLQTAAVSPAEIAAQSPALPAIATECPPIKVRPGAEAIYYYGKGQVGNPKDLQYQAVIDKQSRNCVVSNGLITVKMGVVGRFMLGPSGNQSSVDLPLRFAVERDEAPLFSEKYQIPVTLAGGGQATEFVKVVENVAIPYVAGDDITIWVGFDSNG
ncbi:MAG: hypothetical protein EOP22_15910 [Hyphomicrobiales bacterium]|nr:MAG: hypothetical protein EOP22_15910 [Hyphomicrobiales bacterium]